MPTIKHWVKRQRVGKRVTKPGSQGSSGTKTTIKGEMMKTREVAWFIEKLQTNCIFFLVMECRQYNIAVLTYF